MKKLIFTFLIFLTAEAFFATAVYACDGCGPSSGCNYVGVLPQFRKNFIGIKYNYRQFETLPYNISADKRTNKAVDKYYSAELLGRFFITERIQLIGILPYAFHTRTEGVVTDKIQGFGDAVALVNYTLYNTPDSVESDFSQQILFGAGVKLPTGKYNHNKNGHFYHANFQPGSGSTDFLTNAIYTVRYIKFGLRNDVAYKHNTKNASEYKFGNKISHSASLFYWGSFDGDNAIVPQFGLYQEFAGHDVKNGFYENNTGGISRLLTAGADVYYSRFSAGFQFMFPVQQPQYEIPTKMQHSVRANLNYFF